MDTLVVTKSGHAFIADEILPTDAYKMFAKTELMNEVGEIWRYFNLDGRLLQIRHSSIEFEVTGEKLNEVEIDKPGATVVVTNVPASGERAPAGTTQETTPKV